MYMEEWQAARDLIEAFDQRTHDLRQWGFSFITALLAAQSLLFPSGSTVIAGAAALPDPVKFGVLGVTLVLIVTLRQIEKTYQIYQKAANLRSLVVEKRLNIELGTIITDRYAKFHVPRKIDGVYISFVAADALLGFSVFGNKVYWVSLLLLATAISLLILSIGSSDIHFARGETSDWTFDKLECTDDDTLTITLTNMSGKEKDSITLPKKAAILALRRVPPALNPGEPADDEKMCFIFIKTQDNIFVGPLSSYSWSLSTTHLRTGIYQVFPTVAKREFEELLAKLKKEQLSQLVQAANELKLKFPEKVDKRAEEPEKKYQGQYEKQLQRLKEAAKSLGLDLRLETEKTHERWVYPFALAREITIVGSKQDQGKSAVKPPASTSGSER